MAINLKATLNKIAANVQAQNAGIAIHGGKSPDQVAAEQGRTIPVPDRDGWMWRFNADGSLYQYSIPAKNKSVTAQVSRSLNSTVGVVAKIPAVQTVGKIAGGAALVVGAGAVGVAVAGAVGSAGGAAALKEIKDKVDDVKEKGEDIAKAVELPAQLRPNIIPRPPEPAAVEALFKPAQDAVQVPYKRPESEAYHAAAVLPAGSPGTVPAGTPRELDFLEKIFAGIAKILNIG